MRPNSAMRRRHQRRSVHQVAQHQAVPDSRDESGPPLERPLVGVHQGVALHGERRGIGATAPANASVMFTTEMMLMRPIAAKTDSMMRAAT